MSQAISNIPEDFCPPFVLTTECLQYEIMYMIASLQLGICKAGLGKYKKQAPNVCDKWAAEKALYGELRAACAADAARLHQSRCGPS